MKIVTTMIKPEAGTRESAEYKMENQGFKRSKISRNYSKKRAIKTKRRI